MRDKIIKLIKEHVPQAEHFTDNDYESYVGFIADEILELFADRHYPDRVDWAGIDPEKWGEVDPFYTKNIFPGGHWEHDDAGYMIWVDEEEE